MIFLTLDPSEKSYVAVQLTLLLLYPSRARATSILSMALLFVCPLIEPFLHLIFFWIPSELQQLLLVAVVSLKLVIIGYIDEIVGNFVFFESTTSCMRIWPWTLSISCHFTSHSILNTPRPRSLSWVSLMTYFTAFRWTRSTLLLVDYVITPVITEFEIVMCSPSWRSPSSR